MISNIKHKVFLFFAAVALFSLVSCLAEKNQAQQVDLVVIQQMIDAGKLKQLTIKGNEVIAIDKTGNKFRARVANEEVEVMLIKKASEIESNGKQKVEIIGVEADNNNQSYSAFVFWTLPLIAILLVGSIGFMLGRASKKLR